MRLTKIKLAGFKSFVDPTTISLPSSLVGVVGPNGCGKSNIIDAVRWVMGEISAKHLRGDSMADVIFNGSASRKPVGTRVRRTRVRQLRRQARRRVRELCGGFAEAPRLPRRHVVVFPERRALPPQGHHAAVPRHRPRLAQLRDHRAEHDLARHRGEDRRDAGLPRGGCRHFAVQGAAPRDREPHRAHAREPGPPERPARRGREAATAPAAPGRDRAPLPGAEAGRAPAAGGAAGPAAPRGRVRGRRAPGDHGRARPRAAVGARRAALG